MRTYLLRIRTIQCPDSARRRRRRRPAPAAPGPGRLRRRRARLGALEDLVSHLAVERVA